VLPSSGNVLALTGQNCYINNYCKLSVNLDKFWTAIKNNVDLIELGLVLDNKGMFRVSHEFESTGVVFSDIIVSLN
jgi:hypothetical protein